MAELSTRIGVRQRVSTLLFAVMAGIAVLFGLGLFLITLRLFEIRGELDALRNRSLPVLISLSQLSQDASATSSIAPLLIQTTTRSEFDTLVARIHDKQVSQTALIDELENLSGGPDRVTTLRSSADMLTANLDHLVNAVANQIGIRRQLEAHADRFGRFLTELQSQKPSASPSTLELAARAVSEVNLLLNDPERAKLSRNRQSADASVQALAHHIADLNAGQNGENHGDAASDLVNSWQATREDVLESKASHLSNAFQIKALVEESSLTANRLLGSANNEFWRTSNELEAQIQLVAHTTRVTQLAILGVVVILVAGSLIMAWILRHRVFLRLDKLREALGRYAKDRWHGLSDDRPDEIGEISGAMAHYMEVIDQRESELAAKTTALEGLANQLAKYLSPQVYDSIFTGKQEVKLVSSRKKLTIFFSDIVGFTETADRLESEELTQLLNHYLTEMSQIALRHGATIDKYVGDAILVFFGDPETRGTKADALACVRMAIEMRHRMKELQYQWRRAGLERPLQVRMGIHSGYCTVGNFGSEDRLDYTIVGGAVNIASRLESMAAPGEILISFETFALVQDQVACAPRGETDVKGIAYPVATYCVLDEQEGLGRATPHLCERHPHFELDIDIAAMSKKERDAVAKRLRRALKLLEPGTRRTSTRQADSADKPIQPERRSNVGGNSDHD